MTLLTSYKKWVLLGILLICVLLFMIASLFLSRDTTLQKTKTSNTRPTPFVTTSFQIKSTQPQQHATNVAITSPIEFVFSKSLTSGERASVTITTKPAFAYSSVWNAANDTVKITPVAPFFTSQQYTVSLGNPTFYTLSFTTLSTEQLSYQEQIQAQAQADKNFADWEASIRETYPWNSSLPLQSDAYFVYFDVDKKTFMAKLYITRTSTTPQEDEQQLKAQILARLRTLGVETEKYQFNWQTILE